MAAHKDAFGANKAMDISSQLMDTLTPENVISGRPHICL
jgi:hypothetical protein